MQIALNATSQSIDIRIVDDSGLPVTGLVAATMPTLTYSKAGANADVTITPVDLASLATAWTSSGVKERGSGVYRLDLPNAMLTTQTRVTIRGEDTGKRVICPTIDVGMLVGADVTFTPYTATVSGGIVSDSGKLTAYQHRRFGPFIITVVDEDGDPVNLSAATLVFVATDPDGDGTEALFTVTQASGDITVGGASNNVITIEQDDTNTGTALDFIWTITNTVTDAVVARGNRPVSRIEMTADVA